MKKHTVLSGRSMLVENALIYESDVSVFVRATSRFSHKLDKVDMDRSSSPKRKIPVKSVH